MNKREYNHYSPLTGTVKNLGIAGQGQYIGRGNDGKGQTNKTTVGGDLLPVLPGLFPGLLEPEGTAFVGWCPNAPPG